MGSKQPLRPILKRTIRPAEEQSAQHRQKSKRNMLTSCTATLGFPVIIGKDQPIVSTGYELLHKD